MDSRGQRCVQASGGFTWGRHGGDPQGVPGSTTSLLLRYLNICTHTLVVGH